MSLIVIICTGNMCRSAIAEGIFKKRFAELGRADIQVTSMGIHGKDGRSAAELAVAVCKENMIDISGHQSRALVPGELKGSDFIFAMEPVQEEFITIFFPRVNDRIFLLGSWPGPDHKKGIVKDPIGGGMDDFRKTFRIISNHVERIIPFLLARFPQKTSQ